MRSLAMIVAILLSVQAAEARDCELPEQTSAILTHQIPPRSFFLCILAEIDDLKKKQAELEKIVPEYERLLAELPAHYENRNGKVTFEEGRRIGSASFVLASRQLGGPSSVELDATVIDALCGPPNGCSITLTFRKLGFRTAEPLETLRIGPCQFEIELEIGLLGLRRGLRFRCFHRRYRWRWKRARPRKRRQRRDGGRARLPARRFRCADDAGRRRRKPRDR